VGFERGVGGEEVVDLGGVARADGGEEGGEGIGSGVSGHAGIMAGRRDGARGKRDTAETRRGGGQGVWLLVMGDASC
jgi:hypothetical protein